MGPCVNKAFLFIKGNSSFSEDIIYRMGRNSDRGLIYRIYKGLRNQTIRNQQPNQAIG